jgi:hypothetical protein
LISCLVLLAQSQDWFEKNFGTTCPLPRIRRAFGDMTYDERNIYARVIYQMYLHKEAFKVDQPQTPYSLYVIFAKMHGDIYNNMFHGTSAFPLHHKAYLWEYESALIYTALKDGDKMSPPVTREQACAITLPYWEWELGFTSSPTGGHWNNIANTDVFQYTDLFGDLTPTSLREVDTGLFSPLTTAFCKAEGFPLKRSYTPITITGTRSFNLPSIISTPTNFNSFIRTIHTTLHSHVHNYVGEWMSLPALSGYDPLFYMHHCNVDRLWHAWVDCRGWESLEESQLTDTHYKHINPLNAQFLPVRGPSGAWSLTLNDRVNFYIDRTTTTFLPESSWPTLKQLWFTGSSSKRGWNGLYYRYGPDKLVPQLTSCPDQQWNLLNRSS